MWNSMTGVDLALLEHKERISRLHEEARLVRELRQLFRTRVGAYVFIRAEHPAQVIAQVRRIRGVVKADALQGSSEAIAVVEGASLERLEALIGRIKSLPGVLAAKSKLAA